MTAMLNTSIDQRLRDRAAVVIPGGMWGHQRAAAQPAGYPQFFSGGSGSRVRDVDGKEYIDFMCSWGPIILGHNHPEVEEAVRKQSEAGDCLNGPTAYAVELAEALVSQIPHADWVLFQKNGTDATTGAVTIARAATGRRKVLVARGAYHGAVPWCSPSLVGVTAEDRAHIVYFDYNDVESVHAAVAEAGDLAAILVSAFRHDQGKTQELPSRAFATAVRSICDDRGAVLILDDVRAGFRLSLRGSWETVGVEPDLSCYSKAIANGHPLSALVGREGLREAAANVFVTGSFWYTGGPMAAALATLSVLERVDGPRHMHEMGMLLRSGIDEQSQRHGFELIQSGPPAMPLIEFVGDKDFLLAEHFCREALARGIYLHHRHNMFLNTAHTVADIDRALEATEGAFRTLSRHRRPTDG